MSTSDLSSTEKGESPANEIKPMEVRQPIRLGFILLGLGFLFHTLGLASPYWHEHEEVTFGKRSRTNYGLWRWCVEEERYRNIPYDYCFSMLDGGQYDRDYIRATQFFETVGFLAAIASIILLLLGVCITSCRDKRILPILAGIAAAGAAGCIILGCIIFGAKDYEKPHLSWAFALAIVGGIFYGLAGVLVFVATLVMKR
ncbi:hypothetical protein ACOMHN_059150 [Nucella lapillus]